MALKLMALAMAAFPIIIGARRKAEHLRLVAPDDESVASIPAPMLPPTPSQMTDDDTDPGTDSKVVRVMIEPRGESVTRDQAIEEFIGYMISIDGVGDGASLDFAKVANNYRLLGAVLGWPTLSPKALSIELRSRGCRRHKERRKDGTRPTVITFPEIDERLAA